jgi:hypothetical protein
MWTTINSTLNNNTFKWRLATKQGGAHAFGKSYEIRTFCLIVGKNKGKSSMFGKYQEMFSEVAYNILPI